MDSRLAFVVHVAILCCFTVEAQLLLANTSLPVAYPAKIVKGVEQVCPALEQLKRVRMLLNEEVQALIRNISTPTSTLGVKVADLNMSRPGEQCPDGLTLITSPRRLCRKTTAGLSCDSVIYSTNNTQYKTVCGQVIGHGINSPDAFFPFCAGLCQTIEGPYVDGVSITHGSPREHIWSFAVQHPGTFRCPCSTGSTFTTPSFVGDDYTCETFTPADPVWDGQGCVEEDRLCCQRTSVPLFCRELPEPTTDDIEVRLCTDQSEGDENVAVESIELYIQ